ncbi:GspE/PulE family protein [Clostridium prolinivorans]|uniref:GspE/PulE family protein n=1 Tax=Clostridium prolinivorans TaxID=2769420 RepID=UPI000FD76F0A|nr:GspE/PulE family protein [Clostridium prolinivorans]
MIINSKNLNNINYIDLDYLDINYNAVKLIPKEIMNKYFLVPFNFDKDTISIASIDFNNKKIIDDIKFLTNKEVKIFYSDKNKILKILDLINEKENTDIILEQLKKDYINNANNKNTETDGFSYYSSENSPIVKLTNSIIDGAIKRRASDIHFEPFEDITLIRYRIDGILQQYITIPKKIYFFICTRIKIQSGMDIADKRLPQDGKLQYKIKEKIYDLRVSSIPTIYGEKIVLRILYKKEELMNLKELGFSILDIQLIESFLKSPHGIILVTGPTGSGKTTTLYSMLNMMDKYDKNIITIEDPVEYTIKGVNQVNVNNKAGLTFSSGLRSILRQDPDSIMIGEIRDEETAKIAVRAAITGHLIFSTLHTNDAASSIIRLVDMGVPNYLVADSLHLCIAQRLVRTICKNCKKEYIPSFEEIRNLNLNTNEKLYKGKGCHECNNTGYKHRTVVYEIMQIDETLRKLIIDEKNVDKLRNYNEQIGMNSIKNYCRNLVIKGITTYEEYVKLCSGYFY